MPGVDQANVDDIKGIGDMPIEPKKVEPGDFSNFPEISENTIKKLQTTGIKNLFPVQYTTFKNIFNRNDLIVRDLTGSGKTLAFGLPIVEYLRSNDLFKTGKTQVIILAPARELALQITRTIDSLKHHSDEFSVLPVYGGVSFNDQAHRMRKGVDILVGTTGRVMDHLNKGSIKDFSEMKALVLDEADQMLDQGFKEDVDWILKNVRQTVVTQPQFLLFSATVPDWVKQMAREYLNQDRKMIDLAENRKEKTQKNIDHLSISSPQDHRIQTLADILLVHGAQGKTIVFTETKREAEELVNSDKIFQNMAALHGDISQMQRERALQKFRDGKIDVLVATDVAARGIDIPNIDLVI